MPTKPTIRKQSRTLVPGALVNSDQLKNFCFHFFFALDQKLSEILFTGILHLGYQDDPFKGFINNLESVSYFQ